MLAEQGSGVHSGVRHHSRAGGGRAGGGGCCSRPDAGRLHGLAVQHLAVQQSLIAHHGATPGGVSHM